MTDAEMEARLLRERLADLRDRYNAVSIAQPGRSASIVGRVTTATSLPSGVPKFYLMKPGQVRPGPTEGSSGQVDVLPGTFCCRVLGPTQPAINDDLVCHDINYRWEAHRGGGTAGTTVPQCPCIPMPLRITQTSANLNPKYLSCTYIWGSNPAGAPNTDRQYYSQEFAYDPVTNDVFYYTLFCSSIGYIYIARWFPFGSVGNLYSTEGTIFQWAVGMPGNTCSPFRMTVGQTQAGSTGPQLIALSSP
jgi:hypothetical protein